MDAECLEDRYPHRPYVPPTLAAFVGLVAGGALVLRGALSLGSLALLVLALLVVGLLARVFGHGRVCVMMFVSCLGLLVGGLRSHDALAALDERMGELSRMSVSACFFVVEGDASEVDGSWNCLARVELPSGRETRVWLSTSEEVSRGERLRAVGRFSANADDEWGVSNRSQGIAGRVRVVRIIERKPAQGPLAALLALRASLVDGIAPAEGEGRALLAGVVAGDRRELKARGVSELFSRAGLSHLIAVSGAHLTIVASLAETALLSLGVSARARSFVTLLLTGLFVLLCACPSSAVRSWAMLAASTVGRGAGRRGHAPSSLAIAGACMCLLDPFCACDLGFQLSVLSVGALCLFGAYASALGDAVFPPRKFQELALVPRRARPLALKIRRYVRSSLTASLVCQAATLPLVAVTFGRVSLVGPLASVVVAPLLAPLVLAGLVSCLCVAVPIFGNAVLLVSDALARLVVLLVRCLACLPFSCVSVMLPPQALLATPALGVVLLLLWPQPSARAVRRALAASALLCAALFLRLHVLVPASVTVLDVGQGDAILVREGPHSVLIDTGPSGAIGEALARQNVLWLDAVVITHLHDDHTGGVEELADSVPSGALYVGDGVSDSLETFETPARSLVGERIGELHAGDELRVGGFSLTCLWPQAESDGSQNEDSVCLLLTYGQGGEKLRMLLTGDAESDVLDKIVGQVGDVDVLKVGHHGSRVSITQGEASVLRAEVSVASAGEGNSYGHPTPECVETLEASGSWFLCTKDHGDVTIAPGARRPTVACER